MSTPGRTLRPGRAGRALARVLGSGRRRRPGRAAASSSTGASRARPGRPWRTLAALLAGHGLGWDDVVKTTVFLTDMADYGAFNAIYVAALGPHRPARSLVAVAGLPLGARGGGRGVGLRRGRGHR